MLDDFLYKEQNKEKIVVAQQQAIGGGEELE
jgi:hypothetical protein